MNPPSSKFAAYGIIFYSKSAHLTGWLFPIAINNLRYYQRPYTPPKVGEIVLPSTARKDYY